ncbi:AbfB domain-containing protein, partial [Archangium sp.]|uniref:AbfB domain-containing protein n=1 Tax=Archangium sp. TaxID=1872627 RepID=UPI002D641A16
EARNFPGHYLRHSSSRIRRDPRDGSATFDQDATFCARAALDGSGNFSLESKNLPGSYLRHRDSELWVDPIQNTPSYPQDATWALAAPWWKSAVDLEVNTYKSFQAVTPGFTDRYMRHSNGLGFTEVVSSTSDDSLKQDATFKIVPGLAESSCYSFESRNFPGHYLRHAYSRLRKDARNGSVLFDLDATFCAQPGRYGSGVSFESYNFSTYIRHYNSELWTAAGSGGTWNTSLNFDADVSWNVVSPWAP